MDDAPEYDYPAPAFAPASRHPFPLSKADRAARVKRGGLMIGIGLGLVMFGESMIRGAAEEAEETVAAAHEAGQWHEFNRARHETHRAAAAGQ